MKNLLFITYTSDINTSKGVRHQNIIRYLSDYCKVTVIRHDEFISKTSLVSKSRSFISRLKKLIYRQIIRRFSFPDEYIFIRRWYIRNTLSELKSGSYDAVILGVQPYSFYRIAGIIKKNYPQIKLIIDISDPFYGNVTVLPAWNILLKALAKRYENKYASLADHLVVLNEEIKIFYGKTYGIRNISVIEQGFDHLMAERIVNSLKSIPKIEKSISEPVVLVYGGIFYKKLREPFELYKAVESPGINVKLKLFGKINPKFLPFSSEKIEYHSRVSQEELFREYLQADIIVFIDNAYGIQVPGKTTELMLFNKPILFISSNDQSVSLRYFKNFNKLIRVDNNAGAIRQGLASRKIAGSREADSGLDLRAYYWQNLIPRFLPLIK